MFDRLEEEAECEQEALRLRVAAETAALKATMTFSRASAVASVEREVRSCSSAGLAFFLRYSYLRFCRRLFDTRIWERFLERQHDLSLFFLSHATHVILPPHRYVDIMK